jgi:flagellar biosynthesis protein FlhA
VIAGYTVVDPATVIATHLNQVITAGASELFGMDEAQSLLDALKDSAPQLVANLTPEPAAAGVDHRALPGLLSEGVPLKDFRRVAEAMAEAARVESDPNQLLEAVRGRIGAIIIQNLVPVKLPLPVITLDATLETLLTQAVRTGPGASHPFEPALAQRIVESVTEAAGPLMGRRAASRW